MKKLFLILGLCLIAAVSCAPNDAKVVDDEAVESGFYMLGSNVYVVEIDSCEYLVNHYRMAHKGNCKFCRERAKKEKQENVFDTEVSTSTSLWD